MFKINDGSHVQEIVSSPAFRYGQGFFSTTRIIHYIPLWLEDHIERLSHSLADFSLGEVDKKELFSAAARWPREHHIENGFMRISCWKQDDDIRILMEGGDLALVANDRIGLMMASHRHHSSDPLLGYKSFNYWSNQIAYHHAARKGYYDAVLLNEKGEITETSRCNIFWFSSGTLYTPESGCGLLPGICRDKVISLAEELGIEVIQGRFSLHHLEQAEGLFLTNSVRGVVGISHFEHRCHYDQSGLLTEKLSRAYKKAVQDYILFFS